MIGNELRNKRSLNIAKQFFHISFHFLLSKQLLSTNCLFDKHYLQYYILFMGFKFTMQYFRCPCKASKMVLQ